MNDNIFRKKFNELGIKVSKKLDELFDGATRNAKEFVQKFENMSSKTRLKAIRCTAGLMSLLVLSGFTGCVSNNGDIQNTQPDVTLIGDVGNITTSKDPVQGVQSTDPNVSETTGPSGNETTGPSGNETTGPSGNETTGPSESETTGPSGSETTGPNGNETTGPSGNETTGPSGSETTGPSGNETTGPSGSETTGPSQGETTRPIEPTPEPPEIEDLPGDEDGYKYPQFFADKCQEMVVLQGALSASKYYKQLMEEKPEILFVEKRDVYTSGNEDINVYAKYSIGEREVPVYARFSFDINSMDFIYLGDSNLYSSYEEYVDKIVSSMESKAVLVSAGISEINEKQDEVNIVIGENFAKFIDPSFVDAEINFVRSVSSAGENRYREIYGFGYDENGVSHSYKLEIALVSGNYNGFEDIIYAINNGNIPETHRVESVVKPISSVFTKESQREQ